MRTLACFGDSWPQGGELDLDQEQPYGQLIADRLNCDRYFNFGLGGTSNEHMAVQLQKFLNDNYSSSDQTVAIFHLTNPGRTLYLPNDFTWRVENSEYVNNKFFKELITHFYDSKIETVRYSLAILALQKMCQQYNIKDFYFSGWIKYQNWLPGVDVSRIWAQGQETAGDWFGAKEFNAEHLTNVQDNLYIRPNFAHPNQLGHQLIADKLSIWIADSIDN